MYGFSIDIFICSNCFLHFGIFYLKSIKYIHTVLCIFIILISFLIFFTEKARWISLLSIPPQSNHKCIPRMLKLVYTLIVCIAQFFSRGRLIYIYRVGHNKTSKFQNAAISTVFNSFLSNFQCLFFNQVIRQKCWEISRF